MLPRWSKNIYFSFFYRHVSKNLQCLFGLFESGKKQHDSDKENKKTQKKTTLENDSDGNITASVSKLNKIVFYEDTDSGSWKFVV